MQVHMMNSYAVPVARYDGFGLSLKPPKWLKKVGTAVGKVVDNKIVKGIVATGLAVTGVGVPAAAGILAAQSAAGKAIQGKRIGTIARGAATGAAVGAAAGVAGKVLPKVPLIGKGVTRIRQAVGTAPRDAVTSYDSDSRLDALANQPLPVIKQTPSAAEATLKPISERSMPVLKRLPSAIPQIYTGVKPILKSGTSIEVARTQGEQKNGIVDRIKKGAKKFARDRAIDLATAVTTPPSANPIAPQGGFPAIPETLSPINQNQDSSVSPSTSSVFGMSPASLALIGVVAFVALNNRSK